MTVKENDETTLFYFIFFTFFILCFFIKIFLDLRRQGMAEMAWKLCNVHYKLCFFIKFSILSMFNVNKVTWVILSSKWLLVKQDSLFWSFSCEKTLESNLTGLDNVRSLSARNFACYVTSWMNMQEDIGIQINGSG